MPVKFDPRDTSPEAQMIIALAKQYEPDLLRRVNADVTFVNYIDDDTLGISTQGDKTTDPTKIQVLYPSKYTTEQVAARYRTLLHELSHAERNLPGVYNTVYANSFDTTVGGRELVPGRIGSLTKETQAKYEPLGAKMLEIAKRHKMPSVPSNSTYFNSAEEEILAGLQAAAGIQRAKLDGVLPDSAALYREVEADPNLIDWVRRNNYPAVPSLRAAPTSLLDRLKAQFK